MGISFSDSNLTCISMKKSDLAIVVFTLADLVFRI